MRSKFLTLAERNIVVLMCEEFDTKGIARFLGVSTRTVETHRERIYKKTGSISVAHLVHWAIKNSVYYMNGIPYNPRPHCEHCGAEMTP